MSPRLVLLDTPAAYLDGRRFDLPVHKPTGLLLILACAGDWVGRDRLVSLFWPEASEVDGRHRLRTSLMRARRLPWARGLEVEASRLRWLVDSDVMALREAMERSDWAVAAALHRRPLLDGFAFPSTPGLEAWLGAERDNLASSWQQASLRWSAELKKAGRFLEAAELLLRVLHGDSLAEDALAAYLEAAYLAGQRSEALAQYQLFREALRQELDLEPLAQTSALAALIREGGQLGPSQPQPTQAQEMPSTLRLPRRLVGRDRERVALRESVAQLVLVAAEAGSGKTRLLQDTLPSARWLHAREGLKSVPFHPLLGLMSDPAQTGALAGLQREELALLDPMTWRLPADTASLQEPQTAKTRLLGALTAWLEAAGRPVVVDDLQWADSGTLELLTLLVTRGRLRCYAGCRLEEIDPDLRRHIDGWRTQRLLEEVRLAPLDPQELRELASGQSDLRQAPSELGAWLHARSAGNPFFAVEALKELLGTTHSEGERGEAAWPDMTALAADAELPASVHQVVHRRLGRLSEAARRVLEAASVLGHDLAARPLAALIGLSEAATVIAMEEAEAYGFLQGTGFSHDLWRQSVYQSLATARRRHLHTLVAERLEGSADPLLVAEHWAKGGSVVRALACYHQAADALASRGFPDEALQAVRTATALAEASPMAGDASAEADRLLARLGCVGLAVHRHLGQHRTVLELAERLTGPDREADVRLAACVEKFNVLRELGRYGEANASLAAAERLAAQETLTPYNRRQVTFMCAVVAFDEGRYRDAIALCEGMRDAIRQGTALERFDLAGHLAASWNMLGEHAEALVHNGEALALAKTMGGKPMVVSAAAQLLEILGAAGRPTEGLVEAEAALALGSFHHTAELRHNLAVTYRRCGRLEEAIRHGQALVAGETGALWRASGWTHLVTCYAEAGRPDELAGAIDRGLLASAEIDMPLLRGRMLLAALLYGRPEQRKAAKAGLLPLDWARLPEDLANRLRTELGEPQV